MINYLYFSTILFLIGLWGLILNRKNLILIIMSIEILLLAVNFLFIYFSMNLDDFLGQIISLLILTVAAAESAIGLAILVIYYRINGNILITELNNLKG
jgi:NADH:ubiquinone oxidoreductase subunit K